MRARSDRVLRRLSVAVVLITSVLDVANAAANGTNGTRYHAASPSRRVVEWRQYGFDAGHSGYNPRERVLAVSNVSKLRLMWKHKGLRPVGMPVEAGGVVYLTARSYVVALDAVTGKTIWTRGKDRGGTTPAVANGLVYVSEDSALLALDAGTGKVRWRRAGSFGICAPTVVGRTVYIGTGAGRLFALDGITGEVRWMIRPGAAQDAVAFANGTVYMTTNTGHLVAFDAATGDELWDVRPGRAFIEQIVVSHGLVFAATDHGLFAFDGGSGAKRWRLDGGFEFVRPAVDTLKVYATSNDDDRVYAVNAASGIVEWTGLLPDGALPTRYVVANGVLYVGTPAKIWALDASSGTPLLSVADHIARGPYTNLIVIDGLVIGAGSGALGIVYAFGLPTATRGPH